MMHRPFEAEIAPAPQSAIDLRHERYQMLFAGELPYDPQINNAETSMSGLCRVTSRGGKRKPALNTYLEQVPAIINTLLSEHDQAAKSGEGEAFFAFQNKESQTIITDIVASVFVQWEVTRDIHNLPPMLSPDNNARKWLVVETAAAVATASTRIGFNTLTNKNDRKLLTKVIASRGPRFAHEWLSGKTISQWMEEQEIPNIEQPEILATYNPGTRKHFAAGNPRDPLRALRRSKHNLDEVLTDENIAEHLGWTIEEIHEVFTPGIRKVFAIRNMRDPLGATNRVKYNLEEVLTHENISQELGWTIEKTREVFSSSILKHCAVQNTKNPLLAIKKIGHNLETILTDENIAEELGWTIDEVRQVFTQSTLKDIAVHNIRGPLDAVKKVRRNLEEVLTHENISQELGWTTSEIEKILSDDIRYRLAIHYPNNSLSALETIKHNLDNVLTDEKIATILDWSIPDTQKMFTPAVRQYFAVGYMNNPLAGCRMWIQDKIAVTPKWMRIRDRKLEKITNSNPGI